MKKRIHFEEDQVPIVYSTPVAIHFSALSEQTFGLELKWQRWKHRVLEFRQDGTMVVRDGKVGLKGPIVDKLDLSSVTITHLSFESKEATVAAQNEIGILLNIKTFDGHETQVRMIMLEEEQQKFYSVLKNVVKKHNLDSIKHSTISGKVKHHSTPGNQSIMRSAIASAMDKYDRKTRKAQIIAKRGALKWLPVYFANDLVHGSWWFVIGSICFVISSIITLENSFSKDLGDDDSILSDYQYRASWVLMTISGIFCTLGSIAFMRAVHEDPPMKPLFSWYHVQSDELLGSWLFLFATLPIIPYSLIYTSASGDSLVYLGALAVSIILVIGTYLFVRACYPNEAGKKRIKLIQPIANLLCSCFCSREWRAYHLSNDWLAGTWFIYWGTLLALLVCFVLLLVAIADNNGLLIFIYGTGLFENICFLFGSAYFVAGSYPEENEADSDDDEEALASSRQLPHQQQKSFLCFKWNTPPESDGLYASSSATYSSPFIEKE